jgi:hypothetical protein
MARILTVREADLLSEAREVLREVEQRLSGADWSAGRAAEAVDQAESAVFQALNVVHAYMGCEVAEAFVLARMLADRVLARRRIAITAADA